MPDHARTPWRIETTPIPGLLAILDAAGDIVMVADWLKGQQRRSVTILADANAIGQRTAKALATLIRPVCRDLRLIVPFQGAKDVRSWAPSGDVLRHILANAGTLK